MKSVLPGLGLCIVMGLAAFAGAEQVPLGSVTLVLLAGILMRNFIIRDGKAVEILSPGMNFCEKRILTYAIALMGVNLDYRILKDLGFETLILIPAALVFTVGLALAMGRLFRLPVKLSLLLGVGNAVCGTSAIAAAQGTINAKEEHVGLSVAAVNLFGTLGIFLLPFLANLFFPSDPSQKGILIGNTLQAIGQVTAAGFSLGDITGQTATVVKMGRILLIGPVVLILSFWNPPARKENRTAPGIPGYIIFFLLLSLVGSTGLLPGELTGVLKYASKLLLVTAMAAMGLKIRFRDLIQKGGTALCVGTLVVTGQLLFSILIIRLFC